MTTDARARLELDRSEVKRALTAAAAHLQELVVSQRDVAADDEHDPEGPTVSLQRAEASAMLLQARTHLAEVDAALARIESGSYGTCETCGRDIPAARLEARPFARRCVTCAAREERS